MTESDPNVIESHPTVTGSHRDVTEPDPNMIDADPYMTEPYSNVIDFAAGVGPHAGIFTGLHHPRVTLKSVTHVAG